MALRKTGVILTVQGESAYVQSLKRVNQQQKLMAEQAKLAIAQLGSNAKASQKLKVQLDYLGKQIKLSGEKFAQLKAQSEDLPKLQEELAQKTGELTKEFQSSADETERLKTKYEDLKASRTEDKQSLLDAKREYQNSKAHTKELEQSLKELEKQYCSNEKRLETLPTSMIKVQTATQNYRKEVERLNEEYRNNGGRFAEHAEKLKTIGDKTQSVGQGMSNLGRGIATATTPLVVGLGGSVKTAMKLETAFTGMKKTIDAPTEKLEDMRKELIEMSKVMPITAEELFGIGESAGQLGVQVENIPEFVKTIAQLSKTTNLSSEEGASNMAKFMNVMNTSQSNIGRLGSTIVDLGNNFATTERDITSMAQKLSGAGRLIKAPEASVLALATALSSVGIEADAGGSAMSSILKKFKLATSSSKDYAGNLEEIKQTMSESEFEEFSQGLGKSSEKLELLAKYAGTSKEEFKDMFEKDSIGALDQFIQGLKEAGDNGEDLTQILNDLGIKGIREQDAILRLVGATDLLGKANNKAKESWKENVALTNEAKEAFNTTSSKVQIMKNKIIEQADAIGTKLLPKIVNLMEKSEPLVSLLGDMMDAFADLPAGVQLAVLGAGPAITLFGDITQGAGKAVKGVGGLMKLFGKLTTPKAIGATASALEGLPASASVAGGAATLFSNPWVLAGAAVVGAVGGLGYFIYKEMTKDEDAHKEAVRRTNGAYQDWFDAITKGAEESAENQKLIQDGIKKTGETYNEESERLKQQELERSESFKSMWSTKTYKAQGVGPMARVITTDEGVGQDLKGVSGIEGIDLESMREQMNTFDQIIRDSMNELAYQLEQGKAVTKDFAIETMNSNQQLVDAVLENNDAWLQAEREKVEQEHEFQLKRVQGNEEAIQAENERYEQELANLQTTYENKNQVVQEGSDRITQILATASEENRLLTQEETVEIVQKYMEMAEQSGQSMTELEGANKILGESLKSLANDAGINMLEMAGVIDGATAESIRSIDNQNGRVEALRQAIVDYNNTGIPVKEIETSENVTEKAQDVTDGLNSMPDGKTVDIQADTSGFWSTWRSIKNTGLSIVASITGMFHGSANGNHFFAEGGKITQFGGMFASGANVPKGYSGIVGEAGPELFQFDGHGVTITPLSTNEKIRGIEGVLNDQKKSSINVTINLNGTVIKEEADEDRLIRKMEKHLVRSLEESRGGHIVYSL